MLFWRDCNHDTVDRMQRRSFFTVRSSEMTRAGLIVISIATLAATATAVAQAPAVKVETPSATPKSETAAPEAPVARAMAIQVAPAETKTADTPDDDKKPEIVEAPKPPAPPVITLVAKVDLTAQKVTVFEHGKPKHTWTISSGARGYETPRGTFQPGWMAKMWYSKQYDNSPMPHSVFFKDGAALHATQWTSQLGRPASHGCVRLAPANAAKFYALVSAHGMKHTRISVFGTPRHAPEMVASRSTSQPRPAMPNRVYANNGFNSYAGNYNGYGYYAGNGSAFISKPIAYRPQPIQVRVVQYGGRGSRY
jgi:lipoprotein-anchoring transpeptidase ErfK/SrfK